MTGHDAGAQSAWVWLVAAIVVGLVSGFLFGTQPSVNGQLAKQLAHPLQASIISFASGTVILIVLAVVAGVFPPRVSAAVPVLPWWCWGGGAIGVLLVTASLIFVPRIGSLPWHATIVAGQLMAALLLDHFGLLGNPHLPMSKLRWAGTVFLVTGVLLIFWARATPANDSRRPPSIDVGREDPGHKTRHENEASEKTKAAG